MPYQPLSQLNRALSYRRHERDESTEAPRLNAHNQPKHSSLHSLKDPTSRRRTCCLHAPLDSSIAAPAFFLTSLHRLDHTKARKPVPTFPKPLPRPSLTFASPSTTYVRDPSRPSRTFPSLLTYNILLAQFSPLRNSSSFHRSTSTATHRKAPNTPSFKSPPCATTKESDLSSQLHTFSLSQKPPPWSSGGLTRTPSS